MVVDEAEVFLAAPYLLNLTGYSFFIQLSYYWPRVMFMANLIKGSWYELITIFEAQAYFYEAWVNFFSVWDV